MSNKSPLWKPKTQRGGKIYKSSKNRVDTHTVVEANLCFACVTSLQVEKKTNTYSVYTKDITDIGNEILIN
jgi:hypothetical protein